MSEKTKKQDLSGEVNRREEKSAKQAREAEERARALEVLRSIADENVNSKREHEKDAAYLSRKKSRREMRAEERRRKKEKAKEPMRPATKVILGLLAAGVAALLLYLGYYLIYIAGYKGYEKYLDSYAYEAGAAYTPIPGSNVPGYDCVAVSDVLELYTRPADANVAVYDKRSGRITYSNPQDADNDTVANGANKNFLKSQFMLSYYNAEVVSGTWNSWVDSVQKGTFQVESIANGVRYVYTIGDAAASFVVPLEYRLEGDHLEVSIPASEIQELGNGYVYRIALLRYMGATSYDDTGYMVVPNGSGSLIRFNNGKTAAAAYSQYIYDIDPLAATYTTPEPLEVNRLPLYGICSQDGDILVSIEESATNCVLTAEVSGVYNDYNYIFPTFVFRTYDDLMNFGNSTTSVLVMEKEKYDSNVRVRYSFPDDTHTGYSGLANYYRERLVDEGVLVANESDRDIPFYYDVIAGVKETGHFLGVQYLHSFPMTTFAQAGYMSDMLYELGMTNQVMNLQGAFNGGYYHKAADHVRIMGMLGGRGGLEKLNEKITAADGSLYLDVAFQKVTMADKYFPHNQVASRYYGSGYTAVFGLVNPTTYRNTSSLGYQENRYSALSPKFLPRYTEGFVRQTQAMDLYGYSLRDLGNYLISDKKRTDLIEREEALDIVTGQMALLEGTGKRIMTSRANAYAFPYSTDIINVPLNHTDYAIVDERIPFYEMILHGYINYSSELLNFENRDDMERMRLLLVETGASPHYVFTWEESSRMKLTALNSYYATTFANWADAAAETYAFVNGALKYVQNEDIVKHEILDENLRCITYSNGVSIVVNYGDTDAEVTDASGNTVTVPALDFALVQPAG
ncbi:MAG: hypothetical protein IJ600_01035 [Lachnospiraceae bacterium]|nr:hypothetical protein [Lachnospiraceae bacterium]